MRVNGLAPRARDLVIGGETATVEARLPAETGVAAEKLPLDIVHQDAAVIVINKPPGLVVHPGAGNRDAHAAERAAGARREAAARAARRARASHRQGHQRVVSRGAHARGAHRAGRGARRARDRTRVPGGVHRRDDRRRHGRRAHRPASHAAHRRWRCAAMAARRSRTTASRSVSARTRWRACGSRPGARTRSACISRTSGYPIVGDPVYGGRRRLPPGATPALTPRSKDFTARHCTPRGSSFAHPKTGKRGDATRRRCRRISPGC